MSELVKIAKEPFEVFVDEDGFWRRPPERDEVNAGNINGKWVLVHEGEEIPKGVLAHLERHQPGWVTEGVPKQIVPKIVEKVKDVEIETKKEEKPKEPEAVLDVSNMSKDELELFALKKFGVNLDKRKGLKVLIAQVEGLINNG